MKKTIYCIKFIDGSRVVGTTRQEIKKHIDNWLEKTDGNSNGYFGLTLSMIDGLRYDRVVNKDKHKFIEYFGYCNLKDLVELDKNKIRYKSITNRPYDNNYILKQETRMCNKEFTKMRENNSIDYNKFQTIFSI